MWPSDHFCENTVEIPRFRCRMDACSDCMRPVYTVNVMDPVPFMLVQEEDL